MSEKIYIRNYKQACYYISQEVKPVDMQYVKGRLSFIFNTEDTKDVWDKWKNEQITF